jgi:hypothetical protein
MKIQNRHRIRFDSHKTKNNNYDSTYNTIEYNIPFDESLRKPHTSNFKFLKHPLVLSMNLYERQDNFHQMHV